MKAKNSKTHSRRGIESPDPVLISASVGQLMYIDSLIETSLFSEAHRKKIQERTENISEGEAEELISLLLENQRCNIDGGFNYQQRDIQKKLTSLKDKFDKRYATNRSDT